MIWKDLWPELPQEVRLSFEKEGKTLLLKRGETVYRPGDQPKGLYFVGSGLIGLVLIGSESGREHLLRFFRKAQFFGHRALFSDESYHGTTLALEATQLNFVPKAVVLAAISKHPELLKNVVQVLSKELRRCETHQVMILENQILERTAQSLIYLKDLQPEHQWTRQEIANFCASTVSTIIKAMAELESLGLIKQEGRSITILDREGLLNLQEGH